MAIESETDRALFLFDDGVDATYTPTGGSATTVKGLFDNDIQEVDAGGTATFAVEMPRFVCQTSNVSSAAEGDSIVISSVTYSVLSVFDDGQGMTELRLEQQ